MSDDETEHISMNDDNEVKDFRVNPAEFSSKVDAVVNNVNIPAQFLTELGSLMSFIETNIAHSPILDHDGGRAIVRRLIELIATPKRATACIVLTQLLERFGTQVNATEMDAIRADVIDVKQTHDKKNKTSPAVQKSMLSNMFFYLCLIRAGLVPVSEAKFGGLKKYLELFVEATRHEPLQAIAAESYIMVIELAIKSKASAASIKKKLVDPYYGALVTKSVDQLSSLGEFYIVAKLDHLLKDQISLPNALLHKSFVGHFAKYLQECPPAQLGIEFSRQLSQVKKRSTVTHLMTNLTAQTLARNEDAPFNNLVTFFSQFSHNNNFGELPLTNGMLVQAFVKRVLSSTAKKTTVVKEFEEMLRHTLEENAEMTSQLVTFAVTNDLTLLRVYLSKILSRSFQNSVALLEQALSVDTNTPSSNETISFLVNAIQTDARVYDERKDNPDEILSLLKLMYAHAYFTVPQDKSETHILNKDLPQNIRVKIGNQLAQFLNNLTIQEFNHEILKRKKDSEETPTAPTRMKSWSAELLKYDENELSKKPYERATPFNKEQNAQRKTLRKLLDELREIDQEDETVTHTQAVALKILTASILLYQPRNPAICENADELVNFVKLLKGEIEDEEREPIEVLVAFMLDTLRLDSHLTYACRIAFVAFSSDLNDECFRVMFSHLFHNGSLDEEEEENGDDEDVQMNGGSDEDSNHSTEKESEEEEEVEPSDEESEIDLDKPATDKEMLRADKMLGSIFTLKKQQEKEAKDRKTKDIDYCISICTLLEGLPFKHVRGDIVLMMYLECLSLIHDRIRNPNERILDRVCGITTSVHKLSSEVISHVDTLTSEKKTEFSKQCCDAAQKILDDGLQARAISANYERKLHVGGVVAFLLKVIQTLKVDEERLNELAKRVVVNHEMDRIFTTVNRTHPLLPVTVPLLMERMSHKKLPIDKLIFCTTFIKSCLSEERYYPSEQITHQILSQSFDSWLGQVSSYALEVKNKGKNPIKEAGKHTQEMLVFIHRLFNHAETRKLKLSLDDAKKYASILKGLPSLLQLKSSAAVQRALKALGNWMSAVGLENETQIVASKRKIVEEEEEEPAPSKPAKKQANPTKKRKVA